MPDNHSKTVTLQIVGGTGASRSELRDAIAANASRLGFEIVTSGELLFSGGPTMTLRRLGADRGHYIGLDRALPGETVAFGRPECVFAFCPHGNDCKQRAECRHQRADTADETKPREGK
jgi:hypothetical protein